MWHSLLIYSIHHPSICLPLQHSLVSQYVAGSVLRMEEGAATQHISRQLGPRRSVCATSCRGESLCLLRKGHGFLRDLDPLPSEGKPGQVYFSPTGNESMTLHCHRIKVLALVPMALSDCPCLPVSCTLAIMSRSQAFNPRILCVHFSYLYFPFFFFFRDTLMYF